MILGGDIDDRRLIVGGMVEDTHSTVQACRDEFLAIRSVAEIRWTRRI